MLLITIIVLDIFMKTHIHNGNRGICNAIIQYKDENFCNFFHIYEYIYLYDLGPEKPNPYKTRKYDLKVLLILHFFLKRVGWACETQHSFVLKQRNKGGSFQMLQSVEQSVFRNIVFQRQKLLFILFLSNNQFFYKLGPPLHRYQKINTL